MRVAFVSLLMLRLRLLLLLLLPLHHLGEVAQHLALSPDELGQSTYLSLQLIDLATQETRLQHTATKTLSTTQFWCCNDARICRHCRMRLKVVSNPSL